MWGLSADAVFDGTGLAARPTVLVDRDHGALVAIAAELGPLGP